MDNLVPDLDSSPRIHSYILHLPLGGAWLVCIHLIHLVVV